MADLHVDFTQLTGIVKPMHCVNNGPVANKKNQVRSNLDDYMAAGIPCARNHDASFCSYYGGEHSVDVAFIFPDFSRDPDDETAYDFAMTDRYIQTILDAGTEVFYRLGSKIEHGVKKYNIHPPSDFNKWARVCEHIIRHYNCGWANGFHFNIKYWEIWNEPDLDAEPGVTNFRCWSGTPEEYYELYSITAKHLKRCFPEIKVGGPSVAFRVNEWLDGFLEYVRKNEAPLDFLSWHIYTNHPQAMVERLNIVRRKLDNAGFNSTESILNEYNYIRNWDTHFTYSIEQIIGIKGAAFTAGCMCAAQNAGLDMLMYYDARPCPFNGMFDFYTLRPLKGYYPFSAFNVLYKLGKSFLTTSDDKDVFISAAGADSGQRAVMVVHYSDDDDAGSKEIFLTGDDFADYTFKLLDENLDFEDIKITPDTDGSIRIQMQANSVLLAEKI